MTAEDILNAIETSIRYERKNTLKEHLSSWFKDKSNLLTGCVEGNEFQIWLQNMAVRGYYPVLKGIITTRDDQSVIKLKVVLSPGSYFITSISFLLVLPLLIFYGSQKPELAWVFSLTPLLAGALGWLIYRYESKRIVRHLKEILSKENI